MKKIGILIISMMLLNACGKKNGSPGLQGTSNETVSGSPCVFQTLSPAQIQSINMSLLNTVKEKFKEQCDRNKILKTLGAHLVFEILNYNRQADILGAIENNNLVGYISMVYDEQTCEISLMDSTQINLTKQCKWDN